MSAIISACGKYRWLLTRPAELQNPTQGPAVFLMLNPSTADASLDDPTIRRCRGFAKSWGCDGLAVINLYAFRSTSPAAMKLAEDPVGEFNDDYIADIVKVNNKIICAFGNNAAIDRVKAVYRNLTELGADLYCLGTTKSGMPKHPLYIKSEQPLIPWSFE